MDPLAAVGLGGALVFAPAVKDLLVRLVGPTVDVYGADLRDRLLSRRAKNLEEVVAKASQRTPPSESMSGGTSLSTIVPLLEGASLADADSGLQDRWAGLLASAVAGVSVPPSYPRLLSELTASDAVLLDAIDEAALLSGPRRTLGMIGQSLGTSKAGTAESADNLMRLRLCAIAFPRGDELVSRHQLALTEHSVLAVTALGAAFLRACRGPEG